MSRLLNINNFITTNICCRALMINRILSKPPDTLYQRSEVLRKRIVSSILKQNGWISFDQYMTQVLYTKNLGYYSGGLVKIGEKGDFLTAPMFGKLFARCLVQYCLEIFCHLQVGNDRCIVEFGAGTGQLACDMLERMEQLDEKIDRYLIIEISPDLQERQHRTILNWNKSYLNKVSWLSKLPDNGFTGVAIANEMLDSLPVKCFEVNEPGTAFELGVTEKNGHLTWKRSDHPLEKKLKSRLKDYEFPNGYRSELGLQSEAWLRTVGSKLVAGSILIIDYGYVEREFFHPDRSEGTLMCYYRHLVHTDPFIYPGLQDLTTHVNFSSVGRIAKEIGLTITGYSSQGAFLLSLGILEDLEAAQHNCLNIKNIFQLSQQVKKLILPHEMGEIFKVISLSRGCSRPLKAFNLQNHAIRL